jgi:HPt (histidine-containing phosphotransfer) domain-containing protein
VSGGILSCLKNPAKKKRSFFMVSTNGSKFSEQVFDKAKALENLGGDMDLLKEIIGIFLDDFPNQMKQIREGILTGDAKAVEHAAHSLKGSVANFAAKRAYDAAYRLEVMGREVNLGKANEALGDLEKEVEGLKDALDAAVKGD